VSLVGGAVDRRIALGIPGRRIRAAARAGSRVSAEDELEWFSQDRREHVAGVIRPALVTVSKAKEG